MNCVTNIEVAADVIALEVPSILTGLLLLVSIGTLYMDASHIGLLRVSLLQGMVIAMGTQVLFTALESLGQKAAEHPPAG